MLEKVANKTKGTRDKARRAGIGSKLAIEQPGNKIRIVVTVPGAVSIEGSHPHMLCNSKAWKIDIFMYRSFA